MKQSKKKNGHLRCHVWSASPLEILAEILSYVNSPQDILSVARCSKHLCTTLVNTSNVMIWRRARRRCVVPDPPPPIPGWSEPAYASYLTLEPVM
jgi:hypothetical protein